MDIKTIGVEEWLNVWEKSATWDIAQSTISSLTMDELRALDEQDGATFYERLDREKMNYGWIEGSPEFKAEVAKLYRREVNPDHILQTNGCTGANLNANRLDVHGQAPYKSSHPIVLTFLIQDWGGAKTRTAPMGDI